MRGSKTAASRGGQQRGTKNKKSVERSRALAETSETSKKRRGRPTDYRPEYATQAAKLCELGATEFDLAEFFKVNVSTIWRWRSLHQEFCNALAVGKRSADDRAEMSLYHRAVGYSYDSEKVFCHQGEVIRVPIVEHVPPDVGALSMWLKNRRPDQWREKPDPAISVTLSLADLVTMSYQPGLPELRTPRALEHEER